MDLRSTPSPPPPASPGAAGGTTRRSAGRFLRGTPPVRGDVRWPLVGLGVLGLGLLIATTLLGENGLATHRRLVRERAAAAAEVAGLRERRQELQTRIEALRGNPDALERIAREKYGMKRPGEAIIEIVGGENLTAAAGAAFLLPAPGGDASGTADPLSRERVRPNVVPAFAPEPAPEKTQEAKPPAVAPPPRAAAKAKPPARAKGARVP